MYRRWGKRPLDVVVAAVALAVLAPLLALTAACIWLEDRHGVLFRQSRVGRDGVPFTILKFRSMPVGVESVPSAQATTATVTRVGAVIRRASVDELPQLINVLRGDMSLVGPRPALASQSELVEMRRRSGAAALRPGMTGLAQIRSYDGMPDDVKAGHDAEYASGVTLLSDVGILARTAAYVLKPPPTY